MRAFFRFSALAVLIITAAAALSFSSSAASSVTLREDDVLLLGTQDGEFLTVFRREIFADLNGDGSCTAGDARLALRAAAGLEEADASAGDINGNGVIDASDARAILRSCAGLDRTYLTEEGEAPDGFFTGEGGAVIYLKSGELVSGIVAVGNEKYLFSQNGELLTDTVATLGGEEYRSDASGVLRDGFFTVGDTLYYLDGGKIVSGAFFVGSDMYYCFEDSSVAVNTTIDDFSFDESGKAYTSVISDDTLDWQLRRIISSVSSDPYAIFRYVASSANFSYRVMGANDVRSMAVYMLRYRRGSCYQYAALTQLLYEAAGYESVIVKGLSMTGSGDHWWTMVKLDGVWYHVDTEYPRAYGGTYKKTSAQMRSLGYRWDASAYPVSP